MRKVLRLFPVTMWWKLLRGAGTVVYLVLPLGRITRWKTEIRGMENVLLIRGDILSLRKNRYGILVARVNVHAKCRLYPESSLPQDRIVEVDARLIVGIDHRGEILVPEPP